jgi:hypothetical protein
MRHLPHRHRAQCAKTGCRYPAKKHVTNGRACANVCGVHLRVLLRWSFGTVNCTGNPILVDEQTGDVRVAS